MTIDITLAAAVHWTFASKWLPYWSGEAAALIAYISLKAGGNHDFQAV